MSGPLGAASSPSPGLRAAGVTLLAGAAAYALHLYELVPGRAGATPAVWGPLAVWAAALLVGTVAHWRWDRKPWASVLTGTSSSAGVPVGDAPPPVPPAATLLVFAVGVVGPLSLHSLFFVESGFRGWAGLSMIIVPHAHLVFGGLLAREVNAVLRGDPPKLVGRVGAPVAGATLAAAIPGVVFVGLPPLITAVTGTVIAVPVLLIAARWRQDLEAAAPARR